MAKDKAGYPSIERPFDWGYTDEDGQPRTCVLVKVYPEGERNAAGKGQICDIAVLFPGSATWKYIEKVSPGVRSDLGTIHRLDPVVKV